MTADSKNNLTGNFQAVLKGLFSQIGELAKATTQWQKQITSDISNIIESVKLQFPKIIEHFHEFGKLVEEGAKRYQIAEQKAADVLEKYKWLISPSLPSTIIFELMQIGIQAGRNDAAINKLFWDYFSTNNWQNLEIMIRGWKGIIKKERFDIIIDCLYMLQQTNEKKIKSSKYNIAYINCSNGRCMGRLFKE
jgi:hypothetical protein